MKHRLLLSIISFLTFTHISFAMENKESVFSKQVAAPIQSSSYISYVRYVTNDSVFIADRQGCHTVDLGTRKATEINKKYCSYVAVFPGEEKIALSYNNTIEIYNTKTAQSEWSKTEEFLIHSFGISPQEDTIILSLKKDLFFQESMVVKRNYKKDICDEDYSPENACRATSVFCPKQQLICVAEAEGDVLFYSLADSKVEPKKITLAHEINRCQAGWSDFMVVSDLYGNFISLIEMKDNGGKMYHCLKSDKDQVFERALFYPLGDVLVITSMFFASSDSEDTIDYDDERNSYFMDYWDINTKEFIYRMPLEESANDVSFSADGKNVIIALWDKCKVYSVPFEVRYENKTKERFPLFLFLLKECINQMGQGLVNDFIPQTRDMLLKTFGREKR